MRVRVSSRDLTRYPHQDASLCNALFNMVYVASKKGTLKPAMVIVRDEQVDWYDVGPVFQNPRKTTRKLLAAVAAQDGVECAALLGVFNVDNVRRKQPAKSVLCYVEWPDNRWIMKWQHIRNGKVVGEPQFSSATDGFARPSGLGGWFSYARRTRLQLRMTHNAETSIH